MADFTNERMEYLLTILACPVCNSNLDLKLFDKQNGVFKCTGSCPDSWLLIGGIPRFVDIDLLVNSNSYYRYIQDYREELAELNVDVQEPSEQSYDTSNSIEQNTNKYFGHSWSEGSDWGWIDETKIPDDKKVRFTGGTIEATESAWESKSLISKEEIDEDTLLLDAGCGNGRFSEIAAQKGGKVISVDIGAQTVEAASDNLEDREDSYVIQANLFQLPFRTKVFDIAFSIGVLHHTGDARRAFESLSECVVDEGILTITVYHRLNPIWMFLNSCIRSKTTDLSVEKGEKFAKLMARSARAIHKIHPKLLDLTNLFIRIQPTERHMFDWYSAPIATFHTYSEIERWFLEEGFVITNTNKPKDYDGRILLKPWSATVKGMKSQEASRGGFFPYFD